MESECWDLRPEERPFSLTPIKGNLARAVEELDAVLPDDVFADEIARDYERGDWSIGTEFEVLAPRKIYRGFLVPVQEVATRVQVTLKLFTLIRIAGERDWLVRENHGFGMHYHYVLADKRRTTTMLCWDTRWASSNASDLKGLVDRPIFHQLHNDSSKGVTASPRKWGDKKRKSVRVACVPDLLRQNVSDFLCAAYDSEAVWPRGVPPTPRS